MTEMAERAWSLSAKHHAGQTRRYSGEPYIVHPVAVYNRLLRWGVRDEVILSAALLHDTLEDTQITRKEICQETCLDVSNLVERLTFEKKVWLKSKQEWLESFGLDHDPTARLIKAADRLCNVEDFFKHDKNKARDYLDDSMCLLKFLLPDRDLSEFRNATDDFWETIKKVWN